MADKIQVEIEVGGDGELRFRKLTNAAEEFGSKGQKALDRFSGAFDTMLGFVGGQAIIGGFKAVTAAAGALFQTLIVDGIKAAQEQEDALNEMSTALVLAGNYSADTVRRLDDFAGALQATTKFSDDAVISAAALIESFTGLSEQGLKRATQAAVDLSARFGKDLTTTATAVSKAIEGSTEGLKKFGVHVSEGASKAETLDKVLSALEGNFGGSAKAQVNTFSGAMALLNNQFGEGLEAIGNIVVKNQSFVNVIRVASEVVYAGVEAFKANQKAISEFVSNGLILAIDALLVFTKVGGSFVNLFIKVEGPIKSIVEALLKLRGAAEQGMGELAKQSDRAGASLKKTKKDFEEFSAAQVKQAEEGKRIADRELQKADPNEKYAAENEALTQAFEQKKILQEDYTAALVQIEQNKNDQISDLETKKADHLLAENQRLAADGSAKNAQAIADNNARLKQILDSNKLSAKDRTTIETKYAEGSKQIETQRIQVIQSTLGAFAQFQNAKSKEIAAVGKAAAIAQTFINTYQAASLALATIPPPFGFVAAAANVAAGLLNVAQISGVQLATGLTEVPPGYANDTFPARLSSGERVVDAGTNEDLKGFLISANQIAPLLQQISAQLAALQFHTTVNVGTRTVVDTVREGIQSGRVINA